MTVAILSTSYWTGRWYKSKKWLLGVLSLAVAGATAWLFSATVIGNPWDLDPQLQQFLAYLSPVILGASLFGFAKLFASETEEQRKMVEEFFKKLDTPVNVAKEVFGAGKKQISTFPLVGGTTVVMGFLMSLIFLTDLPHHEALILGVMITVMILFGVAMWYFGKKSEIRTAAQYEQKVHTDE